VRDSEPQGRLAQNSIAVHGSDWQLVGTPTKGGVPALLEESPEPHHSWPNSIKTPEVGSGRAAVTKESLGRSVLRVAAQ